MIREDIRNIAIIAHVDHGKTTLVDEMLKQGGAFRENQQLWRTASWTPTTSSANAASPFCAKNTAVHYKGIKINIVDTPWPCRFRRRGGAHSKNGGRRRIAAGGRGCEGPMPQTRFVLQEVLGA